MDLSRFPGINTNKGVARRTRAQLQHQKYTLKPTMSTSVQSFCEVWGFGLFFNPDAREGYA